jgi:hypothetical protein
VFRIGLGCAIHVVQASDESCSYKEVFLRADICIFRSLITETIPNHRDYHLYFELKVEYRKVRVGCRPTIGHFHMHWEDELMNQFLDSLNCIW